MVRSKNFDNILKVIKSSHTAFAVGSGTVTEELDLELPRGFIAKIHEVKWISNIAPGVIVNVQAALVNDPDDTTTVTIPETQTQHDVICDYYEQGTGTVTGYKNEANQGLRVPEALDVITARNLRVNALNSGSGNMNLVCEVFYTLEAVTSDVLMNLLDIL
jgi:hypothetical protein